MGMYLAVKIHPSYIDNVLNQVVIEQYKSLDESSPVHWINEEDRIHKVAQIKGCLDKFVTSMFQIDRMITHQNSELTNPLNLIPAPGLFRADSIRETCSDFEALLLQSKAALDRLAWFVSHQFKQNSNSFSSLRNILNNFKKKDSRAEAILSLLDKAAWLNSIFVSDKMGKKSLRNIIAHYESIREGVDNCFGIYHRSGDQVLFYDMESKGIPMYKTCWQISKYLPFLILNSLSIFTGVKMLDLSDYEPKWKNFTVVVSEYKSDKGSSLPLIKRFTPDGFVTEQIHVSDEIFANKILFLQMVPKSQKESLLSQGWKHIGNIPNDMVVLMR
ncbi:MAG TPA: hypothetical protein VIP70_01440 [Nitrososphaeraceae archaeon]